MTCSFQCFTDGADSAIHHIGRCNHVGTGFGVRLLCEWLRGFAADPKNAPAPAPRKKPAAKKKPASKKAAPKKAAAKKKVAKA